MWLDIGVCVRALTAAILCVCVIYIFKSSIGRKTTSGIWEEISECDWRGGVAKFWARRIPFSSYSIRPDFEKLEVVQISNWNFLAKLVLIISRKSVFSEYGAATYMAVWL